MAGFVQTDDGGIEMLTVFFQSIGFTVELFTDVNELLDSDGGETRTLATGGGYVEKDLDAEIADIALVGGIPTITWNDITWTFTGPLTGNPAIRGYMIMRNATVIAEELFPAPFTPVNNGDTWTVSLSYALGNGTPT
jgi:hypothetical protein